MDKEECSEACPYKHQDCRASEGFGEFRRAILFIANRGDERVLQPALFGNDHEQAMLEADSGKSLAEILQHCDLTLRDIRFTNILRCLLPREARISDEAYICCERNLEKQVEFLNPKAIVAFGEACFKYMFPNIYDGNFLKQVGRIYAYNNRPVLIEHHLSKIYRLEKPNEAEKIKRFLKERQAI